MQELSLPQPYRPLSMVMNLEGAKAPLIRYHSLEYILFFEENEIYLVRLRWRGDRIPIYEIKQIETIRQLQMMNECMMVREFCCTVYLNPIIAVIKLS